MGKNIKEYGYIRVSHRDQNEGRQCGAYRRKSGRILSCLTHGGART